MVASALLSEFLYHSEFHQVQQQHKKLSGCLNTVKLLLRVQNLEHSRKRSARSQLSSINRNFCNTNNNSSNDCNICDMCLIRKSTPNRTVVADHERCLAICQNLNLPKQTGPTVSRCNHSYILWTVQEQTRLPLRHHD